MYKTKRMTGSECVAWTKNLRPHKPYIRLSGVVLALLRTVIESSLASRIIRGDALTGVFIVRLGSQLSQSTLTGCNPSSHAGSFIAAEIARKKGYVHMVSNEHE